MDCVLFGPRDNPTVLVIWDKFNATILPSPGHLRVTNAIMTSTLPPAIFQQLVQFIQPFMIDPDEREAWITQAFYLREPRIFGNLDRQGAPMVFTVNCVKFLVDSECLVDPNREHAASVLLNTLRMRFRESFCILQR